MPQFTSKQQERHFFETLASEEAFLEWYKKQHFPSQDMPSITVDMVLFCYNRDCDELKILLIKRKNHPFQHSWALPGGFVNKEESTSDCCIRKTKDETNVAITKDHIEQLHTFSTPGRDPRGWVITVSYLAFIGEEPLKAGSQATDASWFSVKREGSILSLSNNKGEIINLDMKTKESIGTESLAFDHAQIILKAFMRVENKMYHDPKLLRVLGKEFTITESRKVYAKFIGVDYKVIDHSNFKKALIPFLEEVGEKPMGVGRPSKIYKLQF